MQTSVTRMTDLKPATAAQVREWIAEAYEQGDNDLAERLTRKLAHLPVQTAPEPTYKTRPPGWGFEA